MRHLAFALLLVPAVNAFGQGVEDVVKQALERYHVPGASIAVVRDGKLELAKGYGLADLENNVPATADTVYELGSVSKQFTSEIVMMLVEEGKVKLDESARTYVPEMPEAWKDVTVRHLLTHTSGLPSYTDYPEFEKVMREPTDHKKFLEFITKHEPNFKPGENWKYNNSGYYLLGMMIEKIEGKPFREVLQSRILKPLGMSHTDMYEPGELVPHRARGYSFSPKGVANAMYIDMGWPFTAGSMLSTVGDMAKWAMALDEGKFLKKESYDAMWKPVGLTGGKTYDYGFGWAIAKINGIPGMAHGGGIPGFNTAIIRFPSKKITVIVLTNQEGGAEQIERAVLGAVEPTLKVAEPVASPDTDPATTAAHKALFAEVLAGTAKPELFADALRNLLFPDRIKDAGRQLGGLGELKGFKFLRSKDDAGIKTRWYKATLGETDLQVMVAVDKAGKIAGLNIQPLS